MLAVKNLNILHFEDNVVQQHLVRERIRKEYPHAKINTRPSLLQAEVYLTKLTASIYDVIVCDYYFPKRDATSILKELSECDKIIIFYTAIDEEEFCENCLKVLGHIPYNFKFIRKAEKITYQDYILSRLMQLIEFVIQ